SLGGEVGALQRRPRTGGIPLVEDQVGDLEHHAEPLGALGYRRQLDPIPASLMCCLARLMRLAMVASGTRNAAAIWAVLRPPTARSVRASCDGGDRAGWQHRNSSTSVSSRSASRWPGSSESAGGTPPAGSNAAAVSRRRRALPARHPSPRPP